MVVVAVVARLAAELAARPVAVRDRRGSHRRGAVHGRSEVERCCRSWPRPAGWRTAGRPRTPSRCRGRSPGPSRRSADGSGLAAPFWFTFLKQPDSVVHGGSPNWAAVGRQVGVGVRVVVRVDDRDRHAVARPGRAGRVGPLVRAREVGRGRSRTGRTASRAASRRRAPSRPRRDRLRGVALRLADVLLLVIRKRVTAPARRRRPEAQRAGCKQQPEKDRDEGETAQRRPLGWGELNGAPKLQPARGEHTSRSGGPAPPVNKERRTGIQPSGAGRQSSSQTRTISSSPRARCLE